MTGREQSVETAPRSASADGIFSESTTADGICPESAIADDIIKPLTERSGVRGTRRDEKIIRVCVSRRQGRKFREEE
jgi:hypothetical protein